MHASAVSPAAWAFAVRSASASETASIATSATASCILKSKSRFLSEDCLGDGSRDATEGHCTAFIRRARPADGRVRPARDVKNRARYSTRDEIRIKLYILAASV